MCSITFIISLQRLCIPAGGTGLDDMSATRDFLIPFIKTWHVAAQSIYTAFNGTDEL